MHHRYWDYAGQMQLDGTQERILLTHSKISARLHKTEGFVHGTLRAFRVAGKTPQLFLPIQLGNEASSSLRYYRRRWGDRPYHQRHTRRRRASGLRSRESLLCSKQPAFQAPPFDKIQDSDYQPAIEAGMAQQLAEIRVIADNPEPPSFENTVVALEKSGRLLDRVNSVFDAVTGANTNPDLQKVQQIEAPKLAAHHDAIFLDSTLFHRGEAVYEQRKALHLDPESLRLIEFYQREFVHAGANLSDADKTQLKAMNEELSTLENDFRTKLLAATQAGAYTATEQSKLAGLSEAQLGAAAEAAKQRKQEGWVLALQNTTQQPYL